jgi:hypothetical protein
MWCPQLAHAARQTDVALDSRPSIGDAGPRAPGEATTGPNSCGDPGPVPRCVSAMHPYLTPRGADVGQRCPSGHRYNSHKQRMPLSEGDGFRFRSTRGFVLHRNRCVCPCQGNEKCSREELKLVGDDGPLTRPYGSSSPSRHLGHGECVGNRGTAEARVHDRQHHQANPGDRPSAPTRVRSARCGITRSSGRYGRRPRRGSGLDVGALQPSRR